MKNVAIILLIMLAGLAAFVYFTQKPAADAVPATPRTADTGTAPKTAAPAAPRPKPVAAKPAVVVLPDYAGTLYLNGKPASGKVEVPAGDVVVSGTDGQAFVHKVLAAKADAETVVTLAPESDTAVTGWTTYQGGNLRTGHVRAADRTALEPVWQKDLGHKVQSSPIILDDTAYFSSEQALIVAVDMKTGEVLWTHGKIGSSVTPVANQDYVFAGSDTGNFEAYRRKDGKVRGETHLESYATSLGLINDDAFLVTTRGNKIFNVQTRKKFTGRVPLKPNWSVDLDALQNGTSAPVIHQGKAFLYTQAGLVAVNLADGATAWSDGAAGNGPVGLTSNDAKMTLNLADEHSFLPPTPACDGVVLYSATSDGVAAYAPDGGRKLWSARLDAPVTSSLSLAYGFLYFGTRDGRLVAMSTRNRAVTMSVPLGSGSVFAAPVVFGDKVLAAGNDGTLVLLNAFSGEHLAESKAVAGTTLYASPAVGDGYILAISGKGRMVCFR